MMDSRYSTRGGGGGGGNSYPGRSTSRGGGGGRRGNNNRRIYNSSTPNTDFEPLLSSNDSTSSLKTDEDEETPLLTSLGLFGNNEGNHHGGSAAVPLSTAALQAMRQRSKHNHNNNRRRSSASHAATRSSSMIHNRHTTSNNVSPIKDLSCWLFTHGLCCCRCVRTKEVGILERFGEYTTLLKPGFYCLMWPRDCLVSHVSLRINQLNVKLETKTKDNVFVHISLAVQYKVHDVYASYYSLSINNRTRNKQITSYVLDVIRSTIPKMYLDNVFAETNEITRTVHLRLSSIMEQYGYIITDTLITHITPNTTVMKSMNEINTCKRIKDAMSHKSEAIKVQKVKKAEGSAESYYLQGVGLAKKRQAICNGIKETMIQIQKQEQEQQNQSLSLSPQPISSSKEIIDIVLLSHYMDTLTHIGGSTTSGVGGSGGSGSSNVNSSGDNTTTSARSTTSNNNNKSMIIQYSPEKIMQLRKELATYFVENNRKQQTVCTKTTPASTMAETNEEETAAAATATTTTTKPSNDTIPDLLW